MSVLIRDMEMPRSCAECRFLEGEAMDGLCHASEKWLDDDDYFLWFQYSEGDIDDSKPANCPLIEIPPHGRLIDAECFDCVAYSVAGMSQAYADGYNNGAEKILFMIDNAPTIIEAEE